GMNALTEEPLIDLAALEAEIVARDRQVANPYAKDLQIVAIHGARRFLADRVTRIAAPHRILDPEAGPLIAVKLHILTRKTLGGLRRGWDARLPRARGHVPRRMPVLRPDRRARRGGGAGLAGAAAVAAAPGIGYLWPCLRGSPATVNGFVLVAKSAFTTR